MNRFCALLVAGLLAVAGCNDAKTTPGAVKSTVEDTEVPANLAKLAAEDRTLAEAQKLCPVTDEPLGSMGVPINLIINDQPVFICCKACEKSARKDPDKTVQKVAELKAKSTKGK